MKILIVDDVFIIRKHIENTLKSFDITELFEAENGVEAIAQCHKETPDVVFLDLNMPVLDGIDALPIIRKALPEALIITMSCVENQSPLIESLKVGADKYLTKPISYYQISEALEISTFKA